MISRLLKWIVLKLIRGYQLLISPMLGSNCRFHPTCSSYAMLAVDRFGIIKGGWISLLRIIRCNPRNEGGMDPVPSQWPGWLYSPNQANDDDSDFDEPVETESATESQTEAQGKKTE